MIDTKDLDADELEKFAALAPIFNATETVFAAWEKAVRLLEIETEPVTWTRKPNRQQRRDAARGRFDAQPRRSRIRRRLNRIAKQKGWWR